MTSFYTVSTGTMIRFLLVKGKQDLDHPCLHEVQSNDGFEHYRSFEHLCTAQLQKDHPTATPQISLRKEVTMSTGIDSEVVKVV